MYEKDIKIGRGASIKIKVQKSAVLLRVRNGSYEVMFDVSPEELGEFHEAVCTALGYFVPRSKENSNAKV